MDRIFKSINFRVNKIKNYIFFKILKLKYVKLVNHNRVNIKFLITNDITDYRAKSFSTKEPKTLNWIEKFEKDKCFWDIGSNVGVYTIYAKLLNKSLNVISFEPSFKNLNILYENLKLNNLNNSITIFPLPLSNNKSIGNFVLGDDVDGGANSMLNLLDNFNQTKYINSFRSTTLSVNNLINEFNFPKPDYIKIDVDGNEMNILNGICNHYNSIKEILIEIDDFQNNIDKVENFMRDKNFLLSDIENFGKENKTANTLFKRQ